MRKHDHEDDKEILSPPFIPATKHWGCLAHPALWRTSQLYPRELRDTAERRSPGWRLGLNPPPRHRPERVPGRPAETPAKDSSASHTGGRPTSCCSTDLCAYLVFVLVLTCMRKTLVFFSMHLLSKYAKIRDSWTGFSSYPNTQPSSPWDDRTAKKQSSTGRWLSARHTHTHY